MHDAMMKALIRSATPGDGATRARLIYFAAKSHLDFASCDLTLSGTSEYKMQQLQNLVLSKTRTWFHYSLFLVVEFNGEVAAGLSGYHSHEVGAHKLRDALHEIGWNDAEIEALNCRLRPILLCSPPEPIEAWTIDHVATLPKFRRLGLMEMLLKRMLESGHTEGFSLAQLDIYSGNTPAREIFEKVGFRIVEEYTHPQFEKAMNCPGVARMVCEI